MTSRLKSMDDVQAVAALHESFAALKSEIGKVIIGQHEIIEQLFIALISRCLLYTSPSPRD